MIGQPRHSCRRKHYQACCDHCRFRCCFQDPHEHRIHHWIFHRHCWNSDVLFGHERVQEISVKESDLCFSSVDVQATCYYSTTDCPVEVLEEGNLQSSFLNSFCLITDAIESFAQLDYNKYVDATRNWIVVPIPS